MTAKGGGTHRRPMWRTKGIHEEFRVRDVRVRKLNRKWAELHVPEIGWMRFRRAILSKGSGLFLRRLANKAPGRVGVVPASWSSLECNACGHVARESRESQAVCRCGNCGPLVNSDEEAADVVRGRTGRVIGRGAVESRRVEAPSTRAA